MYLTLHPLYDSTVADPPSKAVQVINLRNFLLVIAYPHFQSLPMARNVYVYDLSED